MAVVGGLQSLGAREKQEDAFLIVPGSEVEPGDDLLILLADGMGGHAGGEVASSLIVTSFSQHCIHQASSPRPRERMLSSLEAANAALRTRKAERPELAEMGATLISAIKLGERLIWLSVGDSLLYLLREGRLRRLNADHSVHGELLEMVSAGKITRQEADSHPRRNALRSAVIGDRIPLIDSNTIQLETGDLILVASDGLATLSDDRIAQILAENAQAEPRALCATLLNAVEQEKLPRQDNTTVVCYRYAPGRQGRNSESLFADLPQNSARLRRKGIVAVLALLCVLALGLLIYAIGFSSPPETARQPAAAAAPTPENSPTIADSPDAPGADKPKPDSASPDAGIADPAEPEAGEAPKAGGNDETPDPASVPTPPKPRPGRNEAQPDDQTPTPEGPDAPAGIDPAGNSAPLRI